MKQSTMLNGLRFLMLLFSKPLEKKQCDLNRHYYSFLYTVGIRFPLSLHKMTPKMVNMNTVCECCLLNELYTEGSTVQKHSW